MAETTIETAVQALIDYAVAKSLITEDDEICVRNYLMDMLKLEKWEKPSVKEYGSVQGEVCKESEGGYRLVLCLQRGYQLCKKRKNSKGYTLEVRQ